MTERVGPYDKAKSSEIVSQRIHLTARIFELREIVQHYSTVLGRTGHLDLFTRDGYFMMLTFPLICFVGYVIAAVDAATISYTCPPIKIKENVKAWKEIATPTVTGATAGTYTFLLKSVTPTETPFAKIRMYQENGSLYYDNSPGFDYETTKKYDVVVQLLHETSVPTFKCVIDIEDVNEAPLLTNLPNPTSIKENEAAGTVDIYTLTSTDPEKNTITYSITGVKPAAGAAKFSIAGDKVRATNPFNYEEHDHYNVTIKASDPGGLFDTKDLLVQIVDVNEAPYFPKSAGGKEPGGKVTVNEELPIGSVLSINHDFGSFIQAKDVDKGDKLTYFLDGPQNGFFEARNDAGICNIYIKTRIDSETNVIRSSFTLRVFARDSKSLLSTNYYSLAVTIVNINDNLPVCDPTTYSATIAENTPVGTTILPVTCTDADGPIDRYDIQGDAKAKQYFEIDTSGNLKVKDKADLETTSTVKFTADAVQGTPSTSATVTISVKITGQNDNRPAFNKTFYNFETVCDYYPVPPALITIGKTSATDKDVTNAKLSYAWVGNDAVGTFTILKTEGRIIPARELNPKTECNERWLYYIRASDNEPKPTYSDHIPTRIDSFKGAPYLVDFHMGEPTSYFTDARIKRFLSACSAGCNGCLCRLFRMFPKDGTSEVASTLTVFALTDASTELFINANQPKNYVSKDTMINIFDPKTRATSGLRIFDEFTITGMEETIKDPAFHETVGGQIVIALLCAVAVATIIGVSIKCARMQAAKKKAPIREDTKKLQPRKKSKTVDAKTGYDGFNFKYN